MSIILRGWTCQDCGAFNGEERCARSVCRCCDAHKPIPPQGSTLPYHGLIGLDTTENDSDRRSKD